MSQRHTLSWQQTGFIITFWALILLVATGIVWNLFHHGTVWASAGFFVSGIVLMAVAVYGNIAQRVVRQHCCKLGAATATAGFGSAISLQLGDALPYWWLLPLYMVVQVFGIITSKPKVRQRATAPGTKSPEVAYYYNNTMYTFGFFVIGFIGLMFFDVAREEMLQLYLLGCVGFVWGQVLILFKDSEFQEFRSVNVVLASIWSVGGLVVICAALPETQPHLTFEYVPWWAFPTFALAFFVAIGVRANHPYFRNRRRQPVGT